MSSEDWEQSKENVLPLKSGRKLSNLQAAFDQQVRDQQREFETELRLYSGHDELSVWYSYIQWVEQHFPKGGPDGNLTTLLKQCINHFLKEPKYKNDERYVDCWMKYIRYAPSSLEVFIQMEAYEIGQKSAVFYGAWAWNLEQLGNFRRANIVLQEGLNNNAQPLKILQDAQKQLSRKMIQHYEAKGDYDDESEDVRPPLAGLKPIGKKHLAPISRVGDARLSENTRAPMQPLNKHGGTSNNKVAFSVYQEDDIIIGTSKLKIEPTSSISSENENKLNPGPWNKAKIKQIPASLQTGPSKPQFIVHEDPNECPWSGRKIVGGFAQVFTGIRVGVKCFVELDDPNKVYMCDIKKIYGGGEEFQPEEIAAARWFKNEKKRKEQEHILQLERKLLEAKALTHNFDPLVRKSKGLSEQPFVALTTIGATKSCKNEVQIPRTTGTSKLEISSATKDVLALWNGTLSHPSREEVSSSSNISSGNQSGTKATASFQNNEQKLAFEVYVDDQENQYKPEICVVSDDIKENVEPNNYIREKSPRPESSNILQPTTRDISILQDNNNEDNEEDDEDINLGVHPLPDDEASHTLGPLPSQHQFFIAEKYTSTPCQPRYQAIEKGNILRNPEPIVNKIKGLTVNENLSTIIEASREASKSSSGYSTTSSLAQSTRRITSSTLSLPVHSVVQPLILNPFDTHIIAKNLNSVNFENREGFFRLNQNLPKLSANSVVEIANQIFVIDCQLTEGGEGIIYKGKTRDKCQKEVVLKVVREKKDPWEFYACSEIHSRLKDTPQEPDVRNGIGSFVMAPVYNNGNILVSEFSSIGTLLDLANFYHNQRKIVPEIFVLYFTWEMLQIMRQIHLCKFIHADLKPDNFIVDKIPTVDMLNQNFRQVCSLRLIDFGQAIDLQLYPNGTTFNGSVKTEDFVCPEMIEDKPWVYQPDYFGLLGTIHVMLFPEYMKVQKVGNTWEIKNRFKRYWKIKFWNSLFNTLLNVPNCQSFPDLTVFTRDLEEKLSSTCSKSELVSAASTAPHTKYKY